MLNFDWDKLLVEWTKPSGILVVGGFIVWLIQLNWYAIESTKINAQQDDAIQDIMDSQNETARSLQETALLLDFLIEKTQVMNKNMEDLSDKYDIHVQESEMWKERIRNNSNNRQKKPTEQSFGG